MAALGQASCGVAASQAIRVPVEELAANKGVQAAVVGVSSGDLR